MAAKDILTRVIFAIISLGFILMVTSLMLFKRVIKGSKFFKINRRSTAPSLSQDPKWGTHHYVHLEKQGIKLHYVEKGDRNNPLMLCLHGFPECWFEWRKQLIEFSTKYWVVAVDLRGYGLSDKPQGKTNYEAQKVVEDIRIFLQILGKEKCILVAHDWGAAIAWRLVSQCPNLFEKHISINGPHMYAFMDHLFSSTSQMKKSWYMIFFQIPYIPELFMGADDLDMFTKMFKKDLTNEEIEVYKYYYSQEGALTAPLNYYRNMDFFSDKKEESRCKVDSLIIWGVDDEALDKEMAKGTSKYCDKLQIEYVKNASHWIIHENPEKIHKIMWKFLDNQ